MGTAVALAGLALPLTACGSSGGARPAAGATPPAVRVAASPSATPDGRLDGLSQRWLAKIPAQTRQVVVAYGDGVDAATGKVTLYQKTGSRWIAEASWDSHNGRRGWTPAHHENDLRSPEGVFTLTDAGGVLPDPGSKLPYHQDPAFTPPASWGASHRHDFDYVIAIDYNRVQGSSPLDARRPQGESKGGGIWLHLDPGKGSSACVTLPKAAVKQLLRTLDPAQHPVVVMGDRADLAKA
ncbi:L,D-transpeptidase family protein [Streptomyces sp. NPDC092296]|uniref:L,D-transpeptidase family protein n=1 Tax=Streptomyces sp. NPDC092296 TaxID=3366012 RepID=UPI00382523D5